MYILIYFFKIDKDVLAVQDFFNQPNQIYTEQPHTKNVSYFVGTVLDFSQSFISCDAKGIHIKEAAIWNSIFLSYNSRIHHLLRLNELYTAPIIRIITTSYRQNIFHKSSEDEDLEYRFIA
jgi:hypothetical protein